MDLKGTGVIVTVRASNDFDSITLVVKPAGATTTRDIIVSKRMLYSKQGVRRPHALANCRINWEFHPIGADIPVPRGNGATIKQTEERFKLGRGIKDFQLTLSDAQEELQGKLDMYREVLKENMTISSGSGSNVAAPEAPASTGAPAAPALTPDELLIQHDGAEGTTAKVGDAAGVEQKAPEVATTP